MTFLSGVYYPIDRFPDWLAAIAAFLPLTAAVELARPLVLGRLPEQALPHIALLCGYAGAAFWLALALTRRRFVA
jgi:lipooligosaccharide transport system permease protein